MDYCLTPCTKINSKWIKGLNLRPETIKLLEENIGSMLFDISLSNMFLDMSLQERETKTKINKWDYINLKSFCKGKEIVNKAKGPPTCKRMKLEHSLTPYTKINSKWIKDLNVRWGTIQLLEENIGRTLSDINRSKIFFDPPQIGRAHV